MSTTNNTTPSCGFTARHGDTFTFVFYSCILCYSHSKLRPFPNTALTRYKGSMPYSVWGTNWIFLHNVDRLFFRRVKFIFHYTRWGKFRASKVYPRPYITFSDLTVIWSVANDVTSCCYNCTNPMAAAIGIYDSVPGASLTLRTSPPTKPTVTSRDKWVAEFWTPSSPMNSESTSRYTQESHFFYLFRISDFTSLWVTKMIQRTQ